MGLALLYILACCFARGRVRLVLMLPLLLLDCLASVLVGETFHSTLSAKAHDAARRQQRWWAWTEVAIDLLFFLQPNHCRAQYERERAAGGVWRAWLADWRGARRPGVPTTNQGGRDA